MLILASPDCECGPAANNISNSSVGSSVRSVGSLLLPCYLLALFPSAGYCVNVEHFPAGREGGIHSHYHITGTVSI